MFLSERSESKDLRLDAELCEEFWGHHTSHRQFPLSIFRPGAVPLLPQKSSKKNLSPRPNPCIEFSQIDTIDIGVQEFKRRTKQGEPRISVKSIRFYHMPLSFFSISQLQIFQFLNASG